MKNFFLTWLIGFFLLSRSLSAFSENLLQVYRQAQTSDPTFKAAEAQWLATQQLIPINRASLLPQFTTVGQTTFSHVNQTLQQDITFDQNDTQFQLNLSQSVFNYQLWKLLSSAKAQVKEAEANYNAASQNLMLRVATAYFGVLQAYAQLEATDAQKSSLAQQLHQTQEQFKVGLIAITGVEQVKASYDSTLAQEIADKNNVSDKLEELRAITGVFYTKLSIPTVSFPLVSPQPANINEWVKIAAKQNYTLKAAYYAMITARENIKIQRGGHFPVVNAIGQYSYDNQSAVNFIGQVVTPQVTKIASIGVNVSLPVYEGGQVTAQTRQASYQYAQASAQMEQSYRSVLTQARESFLGVMSGISKIKADRQTIKSNQTSLDATKQGYTVGTQTIVDVLQQQSGLYSAQTGYATDRYNYLVNILTLKQAAGTLSERDIQSINSWLSQPLDFSAFNFNVGKLSFEPDTTTSSAAVNYPITPENSQK